jgi:chloride channel protein, CIC family
MDKVRPTYNCNRPVIGGRGRRSTRPTPEPSAPAKTFGSHYNRLIYHTPWQIGLAPVDPAAHKFQEGFRNPLARWTSRMSTLPGDSTLAGAPAAPHAGRPASARPHRPRRAFGDAVLHAPQTLRALVRADEIWLVVLSAFVGAGAGVAVWLMTETTQLVHQALFGISAGERLSAMVELDPIHTLVVPTLGGLALGLVGLAVAYFRPRRVVDPIEANALYGGRMSLNDSLIVVLQTIMSNGVGASIGLEAGYTQIGAALASRFGRMFRVRRNDLRLLVGCGAAAAIAGAFNAPLTGAFYAFELVIGTYSLGTFAPVAVASIVSVSIVNGLGDAPFDLVLQVPTRVDPLDYIPILALGMVCALIGIAIMRGVTLTEELFRKSGVPVWLRPMCGGLAVGTLALATPAVLSSGHGALSIVIEAPYSLTHVGMLVVLKSLASAISIGSGFRGGLFFASLFLGALVGKLFAGTLAMVSTAHAV